MAHLQQLTVKGFKSLKDVTVDFNDLNVLIGANGAGKSNFIQVFELLNNIAQQRLQHYVTMRGGANILLHHGSKKTPLIHLDIQFSETTPEESKNLYYKTWLTNTDNDRLLFYEEKGGDPDPTNTQMVLIDERQISSGGFESNLLTYVYNTTSSTDVRSTLQTIQTAFNDWKVYHFHDTSRNAKLRQMCEINQNLFFWQDGGNLPAFLYLLQQTQPSHYKRIVKTVQRILPNFRDFILRPNSNNPNTIQLEWQEVNSDYIFHAHHLSDGSLRFIALATLLLQPDLPSMILIDEPELGLHPAALHILAGLLESAATKTQVLISTQSVTLINQFSPENILVCEQQDAASTIRRLDAQQLEHWLEDYSIGELWEKNVIGGRP